MAETQDVFARRFGVDRSTYTDWENHGPPKKGSAPKLIERVLADMAFEFAHRQRQQAAE